MIASLARDANPGVRRRALAALQRLPLDGEIRGALLDVLRNDPNPGLRVAAINALESAALEGLSFDDSVLEVLRNSRETDDNNYVRIRSGAFLNEVEYR